MTMFELSQLALKTLENFFTSTDDEIQRSHLPNILIYKYHNIRGCTYRKFMDLVCTIRYWNLYFQIILVDCETSQDNMGSNEGC